MQKPSKQITEYNARYQARIDYRLEGVFNNPYKKGSLPSLYYQSEAQKIRFEWENAA